MLGFDALGRLALGQPPRIAVAYTQSVDVACATSTSVTQVAVYVQAVAASCLTGVATRFSGWVSKRKQNETWTES